MDFLRILLAPIIEIISHDEKQNRSITVVGKCLSQLAGNDRGKKFLIAQNYQTNLIDLIFTLINSFISQKRQIIPFNTIGLYIDFLRQIYSGPEGIDLVHSYKLAVLINNLLSYEDPSWRSVAIENVLNFAQTPKGISGCRLTCNIGVQLLNDSVMLTECVLHLFRRYQSKIGSRSEKFGYGVLVSQLSNTRSGMEAIYSSGLFKSYIYDLWYHLNGETPINVPYTPTDGYALRKSLMNLFKVLGYESVCAILSKKKNVNECKDGFIELFESLILLDKYGRSEALVQYEEAHNVIILHLIN